MESFNFTGYNEKFKEILIRANQIADQYNHSLIGNEHFILALLERKDILLWKILSTFNFDEEKFYNVLRNIAEQNRSYRVNLPEKEFKNLALTLEETLNRSAVEQMKLREATRTLEHYFLAVLSNFSDPISLLFKRNHNISYDDFLRKYAGFINGNNQELLNQQQTPSSAPINQEFSSTQWEKISKEIESIEFKMIMQRAYSIAVDLNHKLVCDEHFTLAAIKEENLSLWQILNLDQEDLDELYDEISNSLNNNKLYEYFFENSTKRNPEISRSLITTINRSFIFHKKYETKEYKIEYYFMALLHDSNNAVSKIFWELFSINNLSFMNLYKGIEPVGAYKQRGKDLNSNQNTQEFPKEDNTRSRTPILDKIGVDLTKLAKQNLLDKTIGREAEISRAIEILNRKKKNNPVLLGEPGVGKSAIAEGIAQLISSGNCPKNLQNKKLVSLNVASLLAGTMYRGQFEERMQNLISEISKSKRNVILFIDEIHTMVGAGGDNLDVSNILKPALSRGEVQCIGATTLSEYQKIIEKDGALDRRFQKVLIEPTSEQETLEILNNVKDEYQKFHNVIYSEEAIEACVKLTTRYISDRFLPDKALDALDEAGAKASVGRNDFSQEKIMVSYEDIAKVVSSMSRIPVEKINQTENHKLINLYDRITEKVIGQNSAVSKIVKAIKRNRTGIKDPKKPIGSFLFLGQTGVGKTQLAKVLAEEIFDSNQSFIRFDMSEFMEKFAVSRLIGSPPGYVGYEEGGELTKLVRQHPYSVILFDEIEKAHSDIFNILLQVLDEGFLTDNFGRKADFRNTIIIMTSNVGAKQAGEFGSGIGFSSENNETRSKEIVEKNLKKFFSPEFLNRIDDIITFESLKKPEIQEIIKIELDKLKFRMQELNYYIDFDQSTYDFLTEKGYEPKYGARPLKRAVQQFVEDELAEQIISQELKPGDIKKVFHLEGDDFLSFETIFLKEEFPVLELE